MSVPASERNVSKMEFFYRAYRLNDEITRTILRDFGYKNINRDLRTFTHHAKMEEQDIKDFSLLCEKYKIGVETEYPLWLIDHYRNHILQTLDELIDNITTANTIYPNSMAEFNLRRSHQWKAISNCYQLEQTLQTVIRNIPVDAEKYMRIVELVDKEAQALRAWKKSDNKIKIRLQDKDMG